MLAKRATIMQHSGCIRRWEFELLELHGQFDLNAQPLKQSFLRKLPKIIDNEKTLDIECLHCLFRMSRNTSSSQEHW